MEAEGREIHLCFGFFAFFCSPARVFQGFPTRSFCAGMEIYKSTGFSTSAIFVLLLLWRIRRRKRNCRLCHNAHLSLRKTDWRRRERALPSSLSLREIARFELPRPPARRPRRTEKNTNCTVEKKKVPPISCIGRMEPFCHCGPGRRATIPQCRISLTVSSFPCHLPGLPLGAKRKEEVGPPGEIFQGWKEGGEAHPRMPIKKPITVGTGRPSSPISVGQKSQKAPVFGAVSLLCFQTCSKKLLFFRHPSVFPSPAKRKLQIIQRETAAPPPPFERPGGRAKEESLVRFAFSAVSSA